MTITVAGHEVSVESDEDPLPVVAQTAMDLHDATKDPSITRGFSVVGVSVKLAPADPDDTIQAKH